MTEKSKQIFADKAKLREKLGIYLQTPEKVEIYAQAAEKMFAKTGGTSIGYKETWSWWAFFFTWGFFLYRKLYLIAVIFLAFLFVPAFIPAIPQGVVDMIPLVVCFASAIQAKYQAIKDFEKKLDLDNDMALATGVNKWAIYVTIALYVVLSISIVYIVAMATEY